MVTFDRWKYEEVELTFDVERSENLLALAEWLRGDEPIDDFEEKSIRIYHDQLLRKIYAWSDEEYKFFFTMAIINLVNFSKKKIYSSFMKRPLKVETLDRNQKPIILRGSTNLVVALGEQIPRQAFFFVNDYKPLNQATPSDPLGQVLITMLAHQKLYHLDRPIFGAYIIENFWNFVVLEKNQYAVSRSFNAAKLTDLFKIFSILKRCKNYIEAWIANGVK